MPPPGGYESIKYKRNLPVRGPGGALIFAATFVVCGLGFWRVGQANNERR
jgi:NADH dehydrogenase (ubiquinone) 1 alpha subcomplex subunit 13